MTLIHIEIERNTLPNIVYKTLGFKWLNQASCPASAFVSADKYEARNPQRFIHATVTHNVIYSQSAKY